MNILLKIVYLVEYDYIQVLSAKNITVSALYCSSYALYIPSLIYKLNFLEFAK